MIKPRGKLTQDQIHAIVMWVSKSVEKLDPKDVVLVDYDFNQLNNEPDDPTVYKTNSQFDLINKYKTSQEKDVYKMYPGNQKGFDGMAVNVTPAFDFDSLKTTTKKVENPSGTTDPSIISESSKTSNIVNSDGTAAPPGVQSNPGTSTTYPIGSGVASTAVTKDITKNYIYNEILTELEKAGALLMFDKSHVAVNLFYGKRVKDITPQTIEAVKQTVSDITGGVPLANITVNKLEVVPDIVPPVSAYDSFKSIFNDYGTFALILFLVIGLMIAALPKRRREEEPMLELAGTGATTGKGPGPRFVVPEAVDESIPEIGLEERSEVKKQINKFVKQKPDAVAQLLRNWLSDEWDN
jgi:flagellar M-ring protein FliF